MSADQLTPQQAEHLKGIQFDAKPYDAIYCSPLARCVETATCLKLPTWTLEPRIAERDLGVFEGLTAEECVARHGSQFEAFSKFDEHYVIPGGGESRAQHFARVQEWLTEVEDSAAMNILAVTHGGIIDFLYRLGTDAPLHGGEQIFAGDGAALSSFAFDGARWRLTAFSQKLHDR